MIIISIIMFSIIIICIIRISINVMIGIIIRLL